jgi:hypothetical protein
MTVGERRGIRLRWWRTFEHVEAIEARESSSSSISERRGGPANLGR